MLKVVIVDDEEHAREAFVHIVKHFAPGFEVKAACNGLTDTIKAVHEFEPEILLMDVELGKESAFDIYNHFPAPAFKTIFITSYTHYAIKAFRFSAVDYLLKPVDPDLLTEALEKARENIERERVALKIDSLLHNLSAGSKRSKRIVLKTADNLHVVNLEDVMYCEAKRSYTVFYLYDKTRIMVSNTLGEYEELFNGFGFIRTHQSYLLNTDYIKRYSKTDGGSIILKDDTVLPVATRKKDMLLSMLKSL